MDEKEMTDQFALARYAVIKLGLSFELDTIDTPLGWSWRAAFRKVKDNSYWIGADPDDPFEAVKRALGKLREEGFKL